MIHLGVYRLKESRSMAIQNAVIYCRVSTEDQEKEGTSLKTQLEACESYCHARGYNIAYRFSETYSGLGLHRPVLSTLRDTLRSENVNVIVIHSLDRLSRDPAHGVILMQEFDRLSVRLEAVTENIETSEIGRLINYIRGYASKIEAEKIKERTMRGKAAYLKEGKLPQGTGKGLYGYNWNKATKTRSINEPEALIVRKMFSNVIGGHSVNKIATNLNKSGVLSKAGCKWSPLTVRRLLTNSVYTGKTYYGQTKRVGKTKVETQPKENWIALPNVTPAIVTDDIFTQAQRALIEIKHRRPIKPNAAYLLTGFIKCAKCGSPIGGTMLSGKYRYYQCRGAKPTSTRAKICDAGYIKADELEKQVTEYLSKVFADPLNTVYSLLCLGIDTQENNKAKILIEKQIADNKAKLKAYDKKEKMLYGLLPDKDLTTDYLLDAINDLKHERSELEESIRHLEETCSDMSSKEKVTFRLSELNAELFADNAPEQISRAHLEACGCQIVAQPGSHKITTLIQIDFEDETNNAMRALWPQLVKEFEYKHPEYSLLDIVDYAVKLPEDTRLGDLIQTIKNSGICPKCGKAYGNRGFSHHCTNMGITT